jgi:hypothetical protein
MYVMSDASEASRDYLRFQTAMLIDANMQVWLFANISMCQPDFFYEVLQG